MSYPDPDARPRGPFFPDGCFSRAVIPSIIAGFVAWGLLGDPTLDVWYSAFWTLAIFASLYWLFGAGLGD